MRIRVSDRGKCCQALTAPLKREAEWIQWSRASVLYGDGAGTASAQPADRRSGFWRVVVAKAENAVPLLALRREL